MAQCAFSAPSALILTVGLYIFLGFAWGILWHFSKEAVSPTGRKRFSNFWRWWLGPDNPSLISCILNWVVLGFFIFNLFRIICTIIYGFCPAE